MITLTLEPRRAGGMRAEWEDRFGAPCSIQECGASTGRYIWVGASDHRMCLDQETAAAVWPLLQRFAETGSLAEPPPEDRPLGRFDEAVRPPLRFDEPMPEEQAPIPGV